MRLVASVLPAVMASLLLAADQPAADPELDRLASWITGSFSSEAQSVEDADFRHIVLHMARIWPARADGAWFYVEQAAASATAPTGSESTTCAGSARTSSPRACTPSTNRSLAPARGAMPRR